MWIIGRGRMSGGRFAWASLACTLALAVGGVELTSPVHGAEPTRPNLVFILLDNVGQEWFGCYGSLENCTPQIDRLAAGGVRFEHCYATPYCSTSRALLLTGRYPHTTGWRFHHDAGIYGGGNFDPRREVTFARLLRDAGYATCVAGKWQINNLREPHQADCLRAHGFDEHLVTPGGKEDSKYWNPLLVENGSWSARPGGYGPDLFTDFAIDFMRRRRDGPFLLYLPLTLVHTPLPATPTTRSQTLGPLETFAENLRYADRLVGRVVEAIAALGLRERTVVFVSVDNGGPPSFPGRTDRGVVRGAMGTFAEPSIDMPMIVYGPGQIPPGRTAPLTDYSDVLPTLAELAGAALPTDRRIDGRSYAAFLRGQAATFERPFALTALNDERVVRDLRYKLYSRGELYDLQADPAEATNLIDSAAPEARAARERLAAVLAGLPPDAPLGFEPESVASRRYRAERAAGESTFIRRK